MPESRYLVDTGPIVAALNRRDIRHEWAKSVFASLSRPPTTSEAVLAEVGWHLRESAEAVAQVVEMVPRGDLLPFPVADTEGVAVAGLIRKYPDHMDLADACIVRLSEMFPRAKVITTDVEHFRIYRRHRNQAIPVIHP